MSHQTLTAEVDISPEAFDYQSNPILTQSSDEAYVNHEVDVAKAAGKNVF